MESSFDDAGFVTGDTHFGHRRINELAGRPFATVEEMDAELFRRWNAVVGVDDVVLHLGDLALGSTWIIACDHRETERTSVPGAWQPRSCLGRAAEQGCDRSVRPLL